MVSYEIDEDFLNLLLEKAFDDTPTFEQDITSGEGIAGRDEQKYNKSLNDLLKTAYNEFKNIPVNLTVTAKIKAVDQLIDEYKNGSQKLAKLHVTEIFNKYQEIANTKAENMGLPTSNDDSLLTDYLLPYQENAINKNAIILREKLVDLVYRLNYFGAAYHGKE